MKNMLKCLLLLIFSLSIVGCSVNINKNSSKSSTECVDETQVESGQENVNVENDNTKEINQEKEEDKQEPSTLENDKKVVVIDPGHGSHAVLDKEQQSPDSSIMKIKDGGGTQGVSSKTPEYVVNMQVAQKLKVLLEKENITVVMTKTTHDECPGNIERANIGNDNNADLVIRIHCDASENQSINGASMLVPAKLGYATEISDISKKYGEIILNSLVSSSGSENRGVVERDDMTGFNWSKVPVVLVEMGFMSNITEDLKLNDDIYQDKLAKGLCEGIVKSLS